MSEMSYLSWPSLFLVLLFLRAILALVVVLRAGPTLMEVFSKGVAEMDTLLPLWSKKGKRINNLLNKNIQLCL